MENISIIFYGKPQSFESYEFNKAGLKKGTIGMPALKPNFTDGTVLHYYVQGGYHYLELYEFATAYDTGRGGVVIGVCVKSDMALAVSAKNLSILSVLLDHFKRKALTEHLQFNTYDLLDIVEVFDIPEITYRQIELNDSPPKNYEEGVKLLFLENYKNNIDKISRHVSNGSDVYLSQGSSIYVAAINEGVWREAGKKILTIDKDGLPVVFESKKTSQRSNGGRGVITGSDSSGSDWRDRERQREEERRLQKRKAMKNLSKIVGVLALVVFAFIFLLIILPNLNFGKNDILQSPPSESSSNVSCVVNIGSQERPNYISIDSCLKNLKVHDLKNGKYDSVITYCDTIIALECATSYKEKAQKLKNQAENLRKGIIIH